MRFPNWFVRSRVPEAPFWGCRINWREPLFLEAILDTIDQELGHAERVHVDQTSEIAAAILVDLQTLSQRELDAPIIHQLRFIRLYIAMQMLVLLNSMGRWAHAFDWINCAMTDLLFRSVRARQEIEVCHEVPRLAEFINSEHPVISANAHKFTYLWIDQFYYYVRKTGGHQLVAQELYGPLTRLLTHGLDICAGEDLTRCIAAACQMASWAASIHHQDARLIAEALALTYARRDLTHEDKKHLGITLIGNVGLLINFARAECAMAMLREMRGSLLPHERLQFLAAACATNEKIREHRAEFIAIAEECAADVRQRARDTLSFVYNQIRAFDIISHVVKGLAEIGDTQAVLELAAVWYGVAPQKRRTAPILCAFPTHAEGILYSSRDAHVLFRHDQQVVFPEAIEVSNRFLGQAVTLADDPSFILAPANGLPSADPETNTEFEKKMDAFYETQHIAGRLPDFNAENSGLFLFPAVQHPVQTLCLKELGTTWPLVSSFEEPELNRPLRKALLLTVGTTTGSYAVQGIAAYLRSHEVDCDLLDEPVAVAPGRFLQLYQNPDYDLIWIEAHGEFDANDPHRSKIILGVGGTPAISLSEIVPIHLTREGRRLLVLNICEGGTAMVFNAPPKMGIAPMLASSRQAVVSHLWPTGIEIAPVFGLLLAISMVEQQDFFAAFKSAAISLRLTRAELLDLFRAQAPAALPIVERVGNRMGELAEEKIVNWGSPVFYE